MKWTIMITALIVSAVALYVALTLDGQREARADSSALAGQSCIARGGSEIECYAMCNTRFHNARSKIRKCGDSVYAASGKFK